VANTRLEALRDTPVTLTVDWPALLVAATVAQPLREKLPMPSTPPAPRALLQLQVSTMPAPPVAVTWAPSNWSGSIPTVAIQVPTQAAIDRGALVVAVAVELPHPAIASAKTQRRKDAKNRCQPYTQS
jgi:hypothetical protein